MRILEATCLAGNVKINGVLVPGVDVLSQGTKQSSGVAILDGDKVKYLVLAFDDLSETLNQVSGVLSTIASTLTAIGSGMTGSTTAPPPTLGASVSQINSVASALSALKDNLK